MIIKRYKTVAKVLFVGFMSWFLIGSICAYYMVSRRSEQFEIAKGKLNAKDFSILTEEENISITGWYFKGDSSKAVIILPGIGANRTSCVSRAEFYLEKGYHVLLPDLRGTGNSGGHVITYGWNERRDLKACCDFLKGKKINTIAVHGCSLGAATITYSFQDTSDYYFVVLESCYDNIDHAFENRVAKFHLPGFVYFPIRFFIQKMIGVKTDELKPEEYIKLCKAPLLMIAGDAEVQVKVPETIRLFENCPSMKKKLHFFKNGKHEDFLKKYPEEYKEVMNSFLEEF